MKLCLVTLYVYNFRQSNLSAIKQAAKEQWSLGGWTNRGHLRAFGRGALDGNMDEKEFVERLSSAIWQANGGFCFITIVVTREHALGEADFAKLIGYKAQSAQTRTPLN
jgi:hypothetical protein